MLLQAAWRVLVGAGLATDAGFDALSPGGLAGLFGGLILLTGYLIRGAPPGGRRLAIWITAGVLVSPVLELAVAGPFVGPGFAVGSGIVAFSLAAAPRDRSRGSDDWRVRVGLVLLAVALAVVAMSELANVLARRTDFTTFLEAARALTGGLDPYAVSGGAYLYPPTFAALLAPLLAVPVTAASLLWFSLKTAWIMHCLAQIFAMLVPDELTVGKRWALATGVLLVTATFWVADLQYGNTNVVILALCVGAVAADLRDRAWLAGLLLALAVTIKLTPVVLLGWFLARQRWRAMIFTAAALVVWNVLPFLWLGDTATTAWRSYVDSGIEAKLVDRLDQPDNQSLWALLVRSLPSLSISQIRPIWLACCAALGLGTTVIAWRVARGGRLMQATTAGMFLVVALLVSPGSWVVHFSLTTLALAALLRWCLERSVVWWWMVFAAINLVFSAGKIWRWSVRLATSQSWFCWAALALVLALGWIAAREPVAPASARQQPSTR